MNGVSLCWRTPSLSSSLHSHTGIISFAAEPGASCRKMAHNSQPRRTTIIAARRASLCNGRHFMTLNRSQQLNVALHFGAETATHSSADTCQRMAATCTARNVRETRQKLAASSRLWESDTGRSALLPVGDYRVCGVAGFLCERKADQRTKTEQESS